MKYKERKKQLLCRYLLKHMLVKVAEAGFVVSASLKLQVPHQHLFLLLPLRRPGPAAG